ncbi:hypothetical protein CRYUN_Cryun01aG0137500 [Craigia yunnanensis]
MRMGSYRKLWRSLQTLQILFFFFLTSSFDGNSFKGAELLYQNGFKEAYAIKGGVRGKKGWLAIQETLLPPSVHIKPKKVVKISQKLGVNGAVSQVEDKKEGSSSMSAPVVESQTMDHELTESVPRKLVPVLLTLP